MITCQSIKGAGAGYMERHLAANDYWSEGETVAGEWFGSGAQKLGLVPGSAVTSEAFGAVGSNRHPGTGDKLTARDTTGRKSWTDIQLSAPKAVSVLAVVGGDERVREAFRESVRVALVEMEAFAGTRERRGALHDQDETRATRNIAAAVYHHDASRELDPQLHAHAVVANATWDAETGSWRALQARTMMQASAYARRVLYDDLACRLGALGYETYARTDSGFSIRGVEDLEERFSGRTAEIEKLAVAWEAQHGRPPTNRERAILTRDSRADKLQEITTPEVRAAQVAKLTPEEKRELDRLTAASVAESLADAKDKQAASSPAPLSGAALDQYLNAGIEHVTERASVGQEWDALAAAMDHAPAGVHLDAAALRSRLATRAAGQGADVHQRDGWRFTTSAVLEEERRAVDLALGGRRAHASPLADLERLEAAQASAERPLLPEQLEAARTLAASRDGTTVLVGDAGTGKTTLLQALQAASGHEWTALGPTTRARDELAKNGFASADTMQAFLRDGKKQSAAAGGVVLVDEAGLVSAADLRALEEAAKREKFRLVLVGDAKQHSSVTRGDALRGVLDASADRAAKRGEPGLTTARLSRVLRQEEKTDREISETLGQGKFAEAIERQEAAGHIHEQANEKKLIQEAAKYLVSRRRELAAPGPGKKSGIVVGVTPRWEDAGKLAAAVRPLLRAGGELRGEDRKVAVVEPLGLTAAQKRLEGSYTPGQSVLTFTRKDDSLGAKAGENWLVEGKDKDGLLVRRLDPSAGSPRRITWQDLGRDVQVGKQKEIALAVGDSILLRAEARQGKKKIAPNGAVRTVEKIGEDGRIHLQGGGVLPATFRHYAHGYSVTSHKSQGASEAEAVVVMGQSASEGASRRQWYVSSTRHKIAARYFVADLVAVKKGLRQSDHRELAGEMITRRKPAARVQTAVAPPKNEKTKDMSEKEPFDWQPITDEQVSGGKLPAYLRPDPEPEPNRERGFTPEDMDGFQDESGRWVSYTSLLRGTAAPENYPAPPPAPSASLNTPKAGNAAKPREAAASNKEGAARTGQGFSASRPMAVKPAPPAAAAPVAGGAVKAPSAPSLFGPVSSAARAASGPVKPSMAAEQAKGKAAAAQPSSIPPAAPMVQAKPASLFGAVSSQAAKIARAASVRQIVKTITRTRTVKTVAAETGKVLGEDVTTTKERVATPKPPEQSQGTSMSL